MSVLPLLIAIIRWMKMGAKSHLNNFWNPASCEILVAVLHLHAKQDVMFWNMVQNTISLKRIASHQESD